MELKLKPTQPTEAKKGDFLVTHDGEFRQVCLSRGTDEYFLIDPTTGLKTTSMYDSIEELLDDVYFKVVRVIPNSNIKLVEI